jgi:hypothetical protein
VGRAVPCAPEKRLKPDPAWWPSARISDALVANFETFLGRAVLLRRRAPAGQQVSPTDLRPAENQPTVFDCHLRHLPYDLRHTGMPNEVDTCRKFVVPKPQPAGWDDARHGNANEIIGKFGSAEPSL